MYLFIYCIWNKQWCQYDPENSCNLHVTKQRLMVLTVVLWVIRDRVWLHYVTVSSNKIISLAQISNTQMNMLFRMVSGLAIRLWTLGMGVPQGSVLGPLLFLLYRNGMPNCLPENHRRRLFADDTTIFICSHSPKALKTEIKMAVEPILKWLGDNKLTDNLSKTQYSIFQTEKHDHTKLFKQH